MVCIRSWNPTPGPGACGSARLSLETIEKIENCLASSLCSLLVSLLVYPIAKVKQPLHAIHSLPLLRGSTVLLSF